MDSAMALAPPPADTMIDYEQLNAIAREQRQTHAGASPFPHSVIDGLLRPDFATAMSRAFNEIDWQSYIHVNENKQCSNNAKFPPLIAAGLGEMNSPRFLSFLTELTGIENLIADTDFGSGGLHQSTLGGYLNIHADFTIHPFHRDWRRRINVLVYLSEQWEESWGGELELWDKDMTTCRQRVKPAFNKAVVFNTSESSFHGHPTPMTCPEGAFRRSIAMYYYTREDGGAAISTDYRSRPEDRFMKKTMIYIDKMLLRFFFWAKTKSKLSDQVVTRVMNLFKGRK